VERWADELEAVAERIGPRFARSEPRRRALGYLHGLLSDAERKNGWQLAEHLGEANPDGVQHLLARANWDADAVRDDLMRYEGEHLGDPAEYARWVLIRRSVSDPTEVAYFACGGPPDTTLRQLVLVAGARWAFEKAQADCTSSSRWVGTERIGYHRPYGVA
jgi:SRSO17 transposase